MDVLWDPRGTASDLSPFRLPRRLGTAIGTDRRWLKQPHRSSRSARWHNRRSPSRSQAQAPTIATRSSPSPLPHEYTNSSAFPTVLQTGGPSGGIRPRKTIARAELILVVSPAVVDG